MSKKKIVSLGVEIAETGLRLALVEHTTGRILHAASVDLKSNPMREPGLIETVVAPWMQKSNPAPSTITITIPASSAVVRCIQVPNDAMVVREQVEWDLATSLNSPVSDFHYDYQLASSRRKGERLAVLVAIRTSLLSALKAGFRKKDLSPQILEVDVFSLLNLAEKAEPEMAGAGACMVKLDRTGLSAVWADGSALGRHHLLPIHSVNAQVSMAGADGRVGSLQWLGKEFASAVTQGFDALGKPQGGRLVFVCGDLATEASLVEPLRALEGTEVRLMDAFRNLLADAEGCPNGSLVQCAGAIGAALRQVGDRK